MYQPTTALMEILALKKRIKIIQGGTSAGKTIAILLYLVQRAQSEKLSISVVSESMPHLKRGAIRDFLNIMQNHNYYNPNEWNRSDSTYNFSPPYPTSYIEFFSADDPAKLRGARRDILFINECNNVAHSAYEQLEVRTRLEVILDFNPVSEFWVHTEVMPHVEHDFLKLTYKQNEALDPAIIASIESRKHNKNWWRVYGLGEVGILEGQVYQNWKPLKEVPKEAQLVRRGLDFGYTNHPTAIVDIYQWNNAFILDEQEYRTGMKNPDIAKKIQGLPEPDMLVVADSAEPKSIDELKGYDINIIGAVKGPGSVDFGIQAVQDQQIFVTERSHNIWKEQRNYLWKLDKQGKPLNVPEDVFNHCMDAARYAIADIINQPEPGITQFLKGAAQAPEPEKATTETEIPDGLIAENGNGNA